MKSSSVLIILVYLSLVKADLNCTYKISNGVYSCVISNANFSGSSNDSINIVGHHIGNKKDDDVELIQIVNTSFDYLPNSIFQKFRKLDYFQILAPPGGLMHVDEDSFRGGFKLNKIFILQSELERIEKKSFVNCRNLYALNIYRCPRLSHLHPKAFYGLTYLRKLQMYTNNLKSLPTKIFKPLVNLWLLELYENKLEVLPDGIFDYNPSLTYVDLRGNKIIAIGPEVFTDFNNINNLLLNTNRYKILSVFFNLLNSEIIYHCNRCVDQAFTSSETNTSLIDYINSNLAQCHDNYGKPSSMQQSTPITRNPSYDREPCEDPDFTCTFVYEGSDYTCLINGVNFTGTEFDVLTIGGEHLPNHNNFDVRSVRINNSSFSTFANRFCCTFPSMQSLSILNGGVRTLNDRSFVNCDSLVKIIFYKNYIDKIERGTFRSNSDLKSLLFFEGSIGSLVDESFEGLINLASLEVTNNNVHSLPDGIFSQLRNLQFIDLHGNPITIISRDLLNNNEKLLSVDLQSTNVYAFETGFFENLPYLKYFNLKGTECDSNLKMCEKNYENLNTVQSTTDGC